MKRGKDYNIDSNRPFRGCWRRLAEEMKCVETSDNLPRDNNRFEVAPWAEATSNIEFVTDLVTENLKSLHPETRAEKTIEPLAKLGPDDI